MPRGRRLLIGREAAGEIFPAPHLASSRGRASSQLFYSLSLFFVVGEHANIILPLIGPSCFGVLLAGHMSFYLLRDVERVRARLFFLIFCSKTVQMHFRIVKQLIRTNAF